MSHGPEFRKPTRCGSSACVEVARDGGEWLIRDSKDSSSPVLRFTEAEWTAFLAGARAGEFDV